MESKVFNHELDENLKKENNFLQRKTMMLKTTF